MQQFALFTALHTFGRDLKWNPHVHLSTTTGGITSKDKWKSIWFKREALMRAWQYQLVTMFRKHYKENMLALPYSLKEMLPDYRRFNHWLNCQYNKFWNVHCGKPSKNAYHNVNYLGRYIKRSPMAQALFSNLLLNH